MPTATPLDHQPARILFVRLSHLGDVIHALPVWHAVAKAFPTAQLAFATQPAYAPLLAGLPHLERIVTFDRGGGPGAWWRYRREVRRFRPTWTIDCQGNWKGAVAAWLSGAPRRSGLAPSDWREPSARRLLNDLAPDERRGPEDNHAVQRQLALARHVSGSDAPADFDLGLTRAELDQGQAALTRCGVESGSRAPLLLHLGRTGDPRSWPAASFFELARLTASSGRRVILLTGPDEADLTRDTLQVATHPGIHAELNTLTLRPLAAFFTAASQVGATLVACDSGPAHLAAAVGLPVHLLFGPQDPALTGPWPAATGGPSFHAAQTAELALDCRPCTSRRCTNERGAECLEALGADQVHHALQARAATAC